MARKKLFKNGTPVPDQDTPAGARKVVAGCTTCSHPDRALVELLWVDGMAVEKIAARFPPLKRDAINRHCANHLSDEEKISYLAGPAAIASLSLHAERENRSLIDYQGIVRSVLTGMMMAAAAEAKPYVVERLSGRLLECLRDIGRTTGEISQFAATSISITNNNAVVMNSPIVAELQSEILQALAAFPEARNAVVERLHALDERHRQPAMKVIEARPLEAAE